MRIAFFIYKMIRDNIRQQLMLLKSETGFIEFLNSMNSSINGFDCMVDELIGTKSITAVPFALTFQSEAQIVVDKLFSSIQSKAEASKDNVSSYKQFRKEIENEDTTSSTDITHESSQHIRDHKIFFRVDKEIKPTKLKVSLRKDCIRKKIRSMFHKHLIKKINSLLKTTNSNLYFKPLPKILSTSLNYSKNLMWCEMSIRELIMSEDIQQSGFDNVYREHNLKTITQVNSDDVNACLDTKWKNAFKDFLQSSDLSNAINEMEKINKSFSARFRKHSSILLSLL